MEIISDTICQIMEFKKSAKEFAEFSEKQLKKCEALLYKINLSTYEKITGEKI